MRLSEDGGMKIGKAGRLGEEKVKESETETDRQTDKQANRQTDRQIDTRWEG